VPRGLCAGGGGEGEKAVGRGGEGKDWSVTKNSGPARAVRENGATRGTDGLKADKGGGDGGPKVLSTQSWGGGEGGGVWGGKKRPSTKTSHQP